MTEVAECLEWPNSAKKYIKRLNGIVLTRQYDRKMGESQLAPIFSVIFSTLWVFDNIMSFLANQIIRPFKYSALHGKIVFWPKTLQPFEVPSAFAFYFLDIWWYFRTFWNFQPYGFDFLWHRPLVLFFGLPYTNFFIF